MDYTVDYIIKNQNQELLKPLTQDEYFYTQSQINALNNQNRIIWEFKKSKILQKYSRIKEFSLLLSDNQNGNDLYEESKKLMALSQKENAQIEKKLNNKNIEDITFYDLEPYLKSLSWHISADIAGGLYDWGLDNFPTRHGYKRIIDEEFGFLNLVEEALNENTKVKYYLENKNYDWAQYSLPWHSFLVTIWVCIENGVGEVALDLSSSLYKLYKSNNLRKTNKFIKRETDLRILNTITWAHAFAYKQVGDYKEYYNLLDNLVGFYLKLGYPNNIHYTVSNRVFEASLLLYKENPTDYNKNRCQSIFHHTTTLTSTEVTETTRERGLVMFDYIQTIFKKDYEKYNNRT